MIARKRKECDARMDRKILLGILMIGLVAALAGAGIFAYFSDTETSTGNVIVAGTIDLSLTGSFTFTDVKPCEDFEEVTVTFRNVGQNPGYLYNKIDYVNKDKVTDGEFVGDISANAFAALIYVKAVTYQHYTYWEEDGGWGWGQISNDLPNWIGMDVNNDGFVSLYEMKQCGWLAYNTDVPEEPLLDGDRGRWVITFHMADSLESYPGGSILFDVEDNRPQADGIELTWTAVLKQTSGPPP